MPCSVFVPDAQRLKQVGYPKISNCPALFHNVRGYERLPNRYLRDRCTGRWAPRFDGTYSGNSGRAQTAATSKGTADRLCNFLNWAEATCRSPTTMTYDEVLTYQSEMFEGRWSKHHRALKPSICNQRADEATFYILWLADHEYRAPFEVQTRRAYYHGPGRARRYSTVTRNGRIPVGEHSLEILAIPSKSQVLNWLSAVWKRRGKAKMLACNTIVNLGTRLTETCSIDVRQWPTQQAISTARTAGRPFVSMPLTITKGGRSRTIQMTVEFAFLVRHWIENERKNLVPKQMIEAGPLFVSDARGYEGTPLCTWTIYACFKLKVPGGPERWHPHLGRHYYACNYVLDGIARDAAVAGRGLSAMSTDWMTARANFWVDTLRRQLGHVSEQTTDLYLRWLVTSYQLVDVSKSWGSLLDGEEAAL